MQRSPLGLQDLVEREIGRWRLERAERRQQSSPRIWPVVTISREYGARGEALGFAVADRLGFRCYDQALVHAMAEEAGLPDTLFQELDEKRIAALDNFFHSFVSGLAVTRVAYLRQLMRVVQAIGEHGSAVIVGRGANFILGPEQAVRLRVVAPRAFRARSISERKGLTLADSEREVDANDAARLAFIQQHFRRAADDPRDYDAVLNLATLPADRAVEVVVEIYHARAGGVPMEPKR
jgi:cytidylate kinase